MDLTQTMLSQAILHTEVVDRRDVCHFRVPLSHCHSFFFFTRGTTGVVCTFCVLGIFVVSWQGWRVFWDDAKPIPFSKPMWD